MSGDLTQFGEFKVDDAPTGDYECLPAGDYTALIQSAELLPTKAGTGHYVKTCFQVVDGNMSGRTVYNYFNIVNANPKCQNIGLAQFADMSRAIGLEAVADTTQLVNQVLVIRVGVKMSTYQGETKNENTIKKYFKQSAAPTPTATPTASPGVDGVPF